MFFHLGWSECRREGERFRSPHFLQPDETSARDSRSDLAFDCDEVAVKNSFRSGIPRVLSIEQTVNDDTQLLRRYAEEGSEPAFNKLVARHIDLVYSAALRQVAG